MTCRTDARDGQHAVWWPEGIFRAFSGAFRCFVRDQGQGAVESPQLSAVYLSVYATSYSMSYTQTGHRYFSYSGDLALSNIVTYNLPAHYEPTCALLTLSGGELPLRPRI